MSVHHERRQRRHIDDEALPAEAESGYPPAATSHDPAGQQTRTRRPRQAPIQVVAPAVESMSEGDRRQAVTALATMIAAWWHERPQHHSPTKPHTQPNRSPVRGAPDPPTDCED